MSKKKDTHPIPDPTNDVTNLRGFAVFPLEEYTVREFHPLPNGEGPATQVHVHFTVKGSDIPFALRFKSAGELDRFIGALTRHRLSVWPKELE